MKTIKVGDKVNILFCGHEVGVTGKPETSIFTVTKVGSKTIIVSRVGRKYRAYHDTKDGLYTYRKIK